MVTNESPLRTLFRPNEIELLICGSEVSNNNCFGIHLQALYIYEFIITLYYVVCPFKLSNILLISIFFFKMEINQEVE